MIVNNDASEEFDEEEGWEGRIKRDGGVGR